MRSWRRRTNSFNCSGTCGLRRTRDRANPPPERDGRLPPQLSSPRLGAHRPALFPYSVAQPCAEQGCRTMPGSTYLAALSGVARDLVLAVLILSALTSILLRAACELGVRAAVQHRWIDTWFCRRAALNPSAAGDTDEIRRHLATIGTRQDVYALDYRQICGLVAAAIQAHLSYLKGDSPFLTAIAAHADADDLGLLRA